MGWRGIGTRVGACLTTPIPQKPVTGMRKSSGTEIEKGPTITTTTITAMVIAIVIAVAAVTTVTVDRVAASDLDTTHHHLIILATPLPTGIIPIPTTDVSLARSRSVLDGNELGTLFNNL